VDTSMEFNPSGNHGFLPPYSYGGRAKANGFNLNVVDLTLDKPQDESPWASGYHVELWMGPDANTLGTQSTGTTADFAIRQAYLLLRTPVGNGINWKVGVFDTPIGYEGYSSPSNPNYTHSYGFTIEPTQHTGILGMYQFCDAFSLSAGVANTTGPTINSRGRSASYKTYIADGTFTAPTNWAWAGGSTLSVGVVNGFNTGAPEGPGDQTSFYAGLTMNTPLTALKVGASVDWLNVHDAGASFRSSGDGDFGGDGNAVDVALYTSYQATEKLALNFRGEFLDDSADQVFDASDAGARRAKVWAFTATAQYNLWKNVLSRLEFRWDHIENADVFGNPPKDNALLLAANLIYQF